MLLCSKPTPPAQSPSLFGRAAAAIGSVFARKPASHYEQEIANAHQQLQSTQKSKHMLADIHTTLQKPLHELSRLEFPELKKLAHHAYYGIGGFSLASCTS